MLSFKTSRCVIPISARLFIAIKMLKSLIFLFVLGKNQVPVDEEKIVKKSRDTRY